MATPLIGWSTCVRIDSLDNATSVGELRKLERIIEKRLARQDLKALDSDSLYFVAIFYKYAAMFIDREYSAKCIRLFEMAGRKAGEVSRNRILRDLAAYRDAVEFEEQKKASRKTLEECMRTDIGVVADAAIALAMSHDTEDNYKKAALPLAEALKKYEKIVRVLRAELKAIKKKS